MLWRKASSPVLADLAADLPGRSSPIRRAGGPPIRSLVLADPFPRFSPIRAAGGPRRSYWCRVKDSKVAAAGKLAAVGRRHVKPASGPPAPPMKRNPRASQAAVVKFGMGQPGGPLGRPARRRP
ncbi:MAG: hypothetical protein ACYC35_00335 [Pirellulales bacterium]